MDIQRLSTEMSQMQVQQDAGMKIQKMAMDTAEQQGQNLERLMASTETLQTIQDPRLGQNVDIFA